METKLLSKETLEKIVQEETCLAKMRESIAKHGELCGKMVAKLDEFDQCLQALDGTVTPLCKKTGSLKEVQINICSLLAEIDRTYNFYTAGIEIDAKLKTMSPATDLTEYLVLMKKLKESVNFLSSDASHQDRRERMQTTYDLSRIALEQEFKVALRRSRAKLTVMDIISSLDDAYELKADAGVYATLFGDNERFIQQMCTWFASESDSEDYLHIYADVASSFIEKILASMHGNNAVNVREVHAAKSRMGSRKDSKAGWLIKRSLRQYSGDLGTRRMTLAVENVTKESELENQAETVVAMFAVLSELLKTEVKFMEKVMRIPRSTKGQVVSAILKKPFALFLHHGEEFLENANRHIDRADLASVFCLLPVLKYISFKKGVLLPYLQVGDDALLNRFEKFIKAVNSSGVCALEKFVEYVKNDQEKFVPSDCTVHQLTSNALMFLQQLVHQDESVAAMLSQENGDPREEALPKYFARVLSALGLSLRNKAEMYSNPALKAMFMLNNVSHILKVVTKNGVLQIISEQNRNVQQYYLDQLATFKADYMRSWSSLGVVLDTFLRKTNLQSVAPGQKLREKDREQIKLCFSDFNRQLETIAKEHGDLVVPDAHLADQLREECKSSVLTAYRNIYEKYSKVNFTKNIGKYFKFTPEGVDRLINSLFTTTLASSSRVDGTSPNVSG